MRRLYWTAYVAAHAIGQGRYPFKPAGAVRRDQGRRVRRTVAYAYRHVPHYREAMGRLGLTPADVQTADDLARLPLVEREDVQRDPERFLSRAVPASRCLHLRTSGSVGRPISLWFDKGTLLQTAVHTARERVHVVRAVGRRFGLREAMLIPPVTQTTEVMDYCRRHAWFPRPWRTERVALSLLEPPSQILAPLNAFRPDVLFSYGSYLAMLFAHVAATGAPFHRPKAVTYSSDDLPAPARRAILEDFRIPVFAFYRAVEAFNIGQECEEHRGIHLNVDLYPLRIVDAAGRPAPLGEPGQVVVSNLVNRGTILLNYRLGDVAALLPEPCPCGRSLPLMSFPPGRADDVVVLPSGRVVHPIALRCVLHVEPLWSYQVVQHALGRFEAIVVPREPCDRPALRSRILRGFAELFGEPAAIELTFAESPRQGPTGKMRLVVSHVPRAASTDSAAR